MQKRLDDAQIHLSWHRTCLGIYLSTLDFSLAYMIIHHPLLQAGNARS